MAELPPRFWVKVTQQPDGCWRWSSVHTKKGYPRIWWDGRYQLAYRVAYMVLIGPIPESLQLDHTCRHNWCANPFHTEPVTCRENLMRGDTLAARYAARTQCDRGHEYDDVNTYWRPDGARECRQCRRDRRAA